jgi:hypothetical protein
MGLYCISNQKKEIFMQIENVNNDRLKLKLPVQKNPMTQKLILDILKINNFQLPGREIFKIGDDGQPKNQPDAPKQDKILCKPKGFADQGVRED